MSSMIIKILVSALAFGAAQAAPAPSATLPAASTFGTAIASITAAPPAATSDTTALFRDLLTAPTAIKRFQRLLTAAGQKLLSTVDLQKVVVFDFNGATPAAGSKGGAVKAANIETFPILTDLGISTTVAFLGPCGMNTPHIHPRATEFLTLVAGEIDFGYILENGLVAAGQPQEVTGSLKAFQGTVFPMGSIHFQVNTGCSNATFVATLNSEDPGTSQIGQNFFGLNADVVNATIGFPQSLDGKDIESFRKQIPANLALGIDSCLKKCNIQKH